MSLQFKSKQIDRVVNIDELSELRSSELIILKDELIYAVEAMNKSLLDVAEQKKRDNEQYDQGWHQRVRRKQKVCEAFLEEIASLDDTYEAIYQKIFMKLLTDYISYEEINNLSRDARIETDLKILELKNEKL
tara:strand:+ start:4140 stop:4538 length:399 start_codon:yes stop_codon:yes gene_type:complete